MPLYLGVDAGGTTTTYVLADAQNELARAEGGSIKRMRVAGRGRGSQSAGRLRRPGAS